MAFTGTATVVEVSDSMMQITGLSLAAAANGTIGLFEKSVAAGVTLPATFQPRPYADGSGDGVAMQASIKVDVVQTSTGATACPIQVVKTGTAPTDFAITISNTSVGTVATFEVYVSFHN
jgi:hypothetical protein